MDGREGSLTGPMYLLQARELQGNGAIRVAGSFHYGFRGLAVCGNGGGFITAERRFKTGNGRRRVHVYYRCTGWKNGGAVHGLYLDERPR